MGNYYRTRARSIGKSETNSNTMQAFQYLQTKTSSVRIRMKSKV